MLRRSGLFAATFALLAAASSAFAADGSSPAQAPQAAASAQPAGPDATEQAGYGSQARTAVEAGRRARDPFAINGRSMYDVH